MTPVPRTAMILAAGRGERMRPLTRERAKPTLPILGVPMLVRVARELAAQGVRRACVNAFHAAESVSDALEGHDLGGIETTLFAEKRLMGSGGAFAAPAAHLGEGETFAAVNADTLLSPPLEALTAGAVAGPRRIGSLLAQPGRVRGYGAIAVRDGLFRRVLRDGEEPGASESVATFLGVAVYRRTLLDGVPRDAPSHLFADLIVPRLADGDELSVTEHRGPWLEFTSPASFRDTLVRLVHRGRRAGRVALPGGDAALRRLPSGAAFFADDAVADAGASLHGAVVLERGARARRGAMLEDAVLLEHAVAEPCCHVCRSVIADGARVTAGGSARQTVVARGAARTAEAAPGPA